MASPEESGVPTRRRRVARQWSALIPVGDGAVGLARPQSPEDPDLPARRARSRRESPRVTTVEIR